MKTRELRMRDRVQRGSKLRCRESAGTVKQFRWKGAERSSYVCPASSAVPFLLSFGHCAISYGISSAACIPWPFHPFRSEGSKLGEEEYKDRTSLKLKVLCCKN